MSTQSRPYATDLDAGDFVRVQLAPGEQYRDGRVRRVRWEPRLNAQDRLLISVDVDGTTWQVRRDALLRTQ